MTQIYSISIVVKLHLEAEGIANSVIARYPLDFLLCLKVSYVVPTSEPATPCFLKCFLGIYEGLHTLVVRGVIFE